MKGRILTKETITGFINHLHLEEKSAHTIEKYARDVNAFAVYLNGNVVSKDLVIEYKQKLIADGYAVSSINSMLAAVNSLFDYLGWSDCKVKSIKTQRQIYCPENKELSKAEYLRLVETAERNHNHRLNMILQTIGGTGIRISELQFITIEAVKSGTVEVACKGKNRVIFIVKKLKKKLLRYAAERHIKAGVTIDRNKVIISTSEDATAPVAVGFRAKRANGKYRYFWLYRVKFGIPATNLATKGDSITFNTPTIEGTVMRRNKEDSNGNHPWKAEVTDGDTGVSASTINGWYSAVYEPSYTASNN